MTASQRAIIPGMIAAFWMGKLGTIFGLDSVVYLLILLGMAGFSIFYEMKKSKNEASKT